jgi:hypothetical protein
VVQCLVVEEIQAQEGPHALVERLLEDQNAVVSWRVGGIFGF